MTELRSCRAGAEQSTLFVDSAEHAEGIVRTRGRSSWTAHAIIRCTQGNQVEPWLRESLDRPPYTQHKMVQHKETQRTRFDFRGMNALLGRFKTRKRALTCLPKDVELLARIIISVWYIDNITVDRFWSYRRRILSREVVIWSFSFLLCRTS